METGYLLICKNYTKTLDRINKLGKSYYEFRNCKNVYSILFKEEYKQYNKDTKGFFFICENNIEMINLLGYGFEGLFDDEDKINEIEEFGKNISAIEYVCITNQLMKFIELKKII